MLCPDVKSKSGVQTLFGTKENLQVAAAEFAREAFTDTVISPALGVPAGAPRLEMLVEHWIDYAEAPLFPGGCFWAANKVRRVVAGILQR
jgi:hypothetical protein